MTSFRQLLAVGCMSIIFAAAYPAVPQTRGHQNPAPLFRASSELVEIDAVVSDKNGGTVRGLTRDDFVVTEDGVSQTIVNFGFVDMPTPVRGTADKTGAAGTATIVTNNQPHDDSRLYVIVLDGFHVDATRSTVVRNLAKQFVDDYIGPNDLAAVVVLGHDSVNQLFTSNKRLLAEAIGPFIGQKSRSATLNRNADAENRPEKAGQVAEDAETGARANEARIAYESIQRICKALGSSQGRRRALVLFSEGSDFDTSDLIGEDKRPAAGGQGLKHEGSKYAASVLAAQQDMLDAARRANVAFYAVDPRGNTVGDDSLMQMQIQKDLSGRPIVPHNTMKSETTRSQGILRTLASETGGFAVVGTNNLKAGFARIVQANSAYYVLGYSPAKPGKDGEYRRISVSVRGRNVNVVARQGYFAASAPQPPATSLATNSIEDLLSPRMRELLESPLPVSGLDLRVAGGLVRSRAGKAMIAAVVEIDTSHLPFTETNGLLSNDIEIGFIAMNARGDLQASHRTVGKLRLPASQRASVSRSLRYVIEIPTSPGSYQLRVAAYETAGGSGGSVLLDVAAPDFAKTELALGSILLTTAGAAAVPTTGSFPEIRSSLPAPPTTVRAFSAADTVTALVSVVGLNAKRGVTLTATVRSEAGREVFKSSDQPTAEKFSGDATGYTSVISIPLASLSPGNYVLSMEARAQTGKTVSGSVEFTIQR